MPSMIQTAARHGRLLLTILLAFPVALRADETSSGQQLYTQQCANCHGEAGEGVDGGYEKPLIGDRSVLELAQIITESMPEDDPESCAGDQARQVAEYIYHAFYSPTARARNAAPQIELARLTVGQYQNVVADLVASFRTPGKWNGVRGLEAEYFKSRRMRRDARVLERRDEVIDFDFGESTPDPERIDAEEFSIAWEGSLLAPETADYEIVVETENAARLWLNVDDDREALIDAWVKSGDQTEYRVTVPLVGGRTYPLKLDFFTYKEPTASISLKWKRPHRPVEVIPARFLTPQRFPETLVVTTPFPPDDRSYGYDRATSISKAWYEATTYAAIEVANYVVAHLDRLAGTREGADNRREKVRAFCRQFTERAWRQPLSQSQQAFFVDRFLEGSGPLEQAVKQCLLLVLKSPRFLYREVDYREVDYREVDQNQPDPFVLASRLSFGMWDSIPDQLLWKAAVDGKLRDPAEVRRQAERMVTDHRTRAKLRQFFEQWLKLDHLHDLSKSTDRFPDFDERVISDLRTSLELFLEESVWGDSSDYRQLLLSSELYLNGRLAEFYDADLPVAADFQRVSLQPEHRAGVLSHPFLLAGFAYYESSSPIHRGVFLARSILGRTLRPPPQAVAPLPPELHADLTTRERVILQTQAAACQNCHGMINPLGFSLEHFDAVGRFREQENGRPIDAAGSYITRDGEQVEFHGIRPLAEFLAESEETHAAFVEQLFHHFVKQPIRAYGSNRNEQLTAEFQQQEFSIQRLLVEIAAVAALQTRG